MLESVLNRRGQFSEQMKIMKNMMRDEESVVAINATEEKKME